MTTVSPNNSFWKASGVITTKNFCWPFTFVNSVDIRLNSHSLMSEMCFIVALKRVHSWNGLFWLIASITSFCKSLVYHEDVVAWVLKKEYNMEERFLSMFPGLPVIFEATTLSTLLLLVRDTTFYNVQYSETVLQWIIIAQAQNNEQLAQLQMQAIYRCKAMKSARWEFWANIYSFLSLTYCWAIKEAAIWLIQHCFHLLLSNALAVTTSTIWFGGTLHSDAHDILQLSSTYFFCLALCNYYKSSSACNVGSKLS